MSANQINSVPASTRRKNFVGVNITNILDSLGCYDDVGQQIAIILLHQMLTTYASTETPDAERYAVYLWFFEGEPDSFGRTFEEILCVLNIDNYEDYILDFAVDVCPSFWSIKAYRQKQFESSSELLKTLIALIKTGNSKSRRDALNFFYNGATYGGLSFGEVCNWAEVFAEDVWSEVDFVLGRQRSLIESNISIETSRIVEIECATKARSEFPTISRKEIAEYNDSRHNQLF